jgi:hypothetical protein
MIEPQKARAEVSPGPECPSYAWQVEHVPAYGRRINIVRVATQAEA